MSCCLDNQWRGVLVKRGLSDLVKEQKQKKCRAEGEKERGGGGGVAGVIWPEEEIKEVFM